MYAPIKIVIADDHDIFRDGFKLLLKKQAWLELAGEATNGQELLQVTEQCLPDVVITDIKMPLMDGIEATKKLKKTHPHIGVIALTMFNDDNLVVDMLEAGARGYLLKNTNQHEVIQAAKAVYEGGTYYCSATSGKLAKLIAASKFNPYKKTPQPQLTSRELEIVQLLCQEFSTKEIAAALHISPRTVEGHREKIQEKIGAKNIVGVIVYAIKHKLYNV